MLAFVIGKLKYERKMVIRVVVHHLVLEELPTVHLAEGIYTLHTLHQATQTLLVAGAEIWHSIATVLNLFLFIERPVIIEKDFRPSEGSGKGYAKLTMVKQKMARKSSYWPHLLAALQGLLTH